MVAMSPELTKQLQTLRAKYAALSARDQLALKSMTTFLVIALLYFAVWQPASNSASEAKNRFEKERVDLAAMYATENLARAYKQTSGRQGVSTRDQAILTIINNTSKRAGITLKRVEPEGDDKIRAWVEHVPFDTVVQWAVGLDQRHGIKVTVLTLDADEKPGLISGRLTLER